MAQPRNEHGLTPPQEVFAKCLAEGMTQADAYRAAYPTSQNWKDKSLWTNASMLAKNPLVVRRVQVLKEPLIRRAQEHAEYTLQTAMDEAMEAFQVSKLQGQGGAMVAAAALRAKLKGYMIDRKEVAVSQLGNMPAMEKMQVMQAVQEAMEAKRRLAQLRGDVDDVQDVTPK